MRRILDFENPVFQFLGRVGDLMITNFLFLLCCVPVVTAGASFAAMTRVTQGIVNDMGSGPFKTFFKAFRANFRQATALWVASRVIFGAMACNLLLIGTYVSGTAALVLRCAVWVFTAAVLMVGSCMFPLIVRYENTLKEHCFNAMILAVGKLPRVAAMTLMNVLPLLLAYFSIAAFLRSLAFWVIIGCAVMNYLNSCVMRGVLRQLEKADAPETDAREMDRGEEKSGDA